MAGGGAASMDDPLYVNQRTLVAVRAAVESADDSSTYVPAHACTPKVVRQAVEAGVKCIEHGQLLDEDTLRRVADKGVWLSLQPFLVDEDRIPFPIGSPSRIKQLQMISGTDNAYRCAKRHGVTLACGTDTLFDPRLVTRQGAQLAKLTRWFTPAEVLRMATSTNAELLTLSGLRNPYPGKLGVMQEGALADRLLVDGDPRANIRLIEDPVRSSAVIMKDGKVQENSLR